MIGLKDIRYEIDSLTKVPHILFTGSRGTGKSTLAKYIAESKKKNLIFTVGNTLKKQEILNIFINIEEGDVLLIDEIHRLNPAVEELLYHPMEEFKLPLKDVGGMFQTFPIPKFSLVGTTTKPSSISKPLISRFQITFQIPHYNIRELALIIRSHYPNINVYNALRIANNIVTPREAINLSRRILSLCKSEDVNTEIIKNLEFIGFKYGLSKAERYYLKIVHNVGKISLTSLSNALQIDKDEVKYVEDKLIRKNLIDIGTKGRFLTFKGLLKIKEMAK
jgi:Holliday junction DNA helicase RuvB